MGRRRRAQADGEQGGSHSRVAGACALDKLPSPVLNLWRHLPDHPNTFWGLLLVPTTSLPRCLGFRENLRPFSVPKPPFSHKVISYVFTES